MVFFFKICEPDYLVYMGRDKYENEDLIKYGWPEDIWFHVDDLSSAHVYLRLKKGETINDIPQNVLEECCQLVKQNSIQGCKESSVNIVYTPWANLKKTRDMEPGQVLYHNEAASFFIYLLIRLTYNVKHLSISPEQIRYVKNVKKVPLIINRIEKSREERDVRLKEEREERDREERHEKRAQAEQVKRADIKAQEEKKKQQDIKHYTAVMKSENMKSNKYQSMEDDDFM
ncbi:coiled-coil domain-containing protein 25 [Heterostelium album PN500]|uniref:Coiled-coil domain-containing protein 25 n=1 Tax=Heterostelium pallidum (strain ATCC 26659 / Pp 5 / PN500) TaxID=670386 RepID=D3BJM4_HETP5|nr:coiled-coil domain-containing protein 25 [Heterostelium album PN500]EFA78104.1 coiled-coil domain-containing protein 25 [Heterostelium album PN500]|eukprot:XP_020430231.1 coiled-coil domain-containing protein 25 [Heterostelium album PN500]